MTRQGLLAAAAVGALLSDAAQAGTLFIARMTGANEVPPNASTFTGTGTLILNDAKTSATVSGTHNITPTTTVVAGHIHRGVAGVNGPVIFPFPNPNAITNLTWAIPAADVTNLEAGGLYFNIHTQARPGGEIRAQLLRATLAPAATNATQAAVAAAMDVSYGFAADLDQALIRTNLAAAAAQTQALDELSGRSLYVQARQGLEAMAGVANSVFAGLDDDRFAGRTADEGLSALVRIGHDFGTRDVAAQETGAKISRTYGLIGMVYHTGEGPSVGAALGQANGDDKLKGGAGKTEADITSVTGFFSSDLADNVAFDGLVSYGWGDIDTTRNLTSFSATATGETDSKTWGVAGRLSAWFDTGGAATIAPYLSVDYRHSKVDGYTEAGAGSLGLIVPEQKRKNANAELGAALALPLGSATARVNAGWQQRLSGKATTVATRLVGSAVGFSTPVLGLPKSAGKIGASIGGEFTDGISGSLGYRGLVGASRMNLHAIEARIAVRF